MLRVLGLSFSLVVLLGACISYSGGEPDRDRVTYESFEARQEKVVLQEPGQDGEAIHIAYSRRGGSGGGNAVVLLHGVPSSSWRYRYVLEDLQDDDLVVIAPDLLGYGSSSKPQTPVARELAARRPDLFGGARGARYGRATRGLLSALPRPPRRLSVDHFLAGAAFRGYLGGTGRESACYSLS